MLETEQNESAVESEFLWTWFIILDKFIIQEIKLKTYLIFNQSLLNNCLLFIFITFHCLFIFSNPLTFKIMFPGNLYNDAFKIMMYNKHIFKV